MECSLKYNFNAAEREDYQKSTHCPSVTNHSCITGHFMMQCNTPQSTGYINRWNRTLDCKQHSARCLNAQSVNTIS